MPFTMLLQIQVYPPSDMVFATPKKQMHRARLGYNQLTGGAGRHGTVILTVFIGFIVLAVVWHTSPILQLLSRLRGRFSKADNPGVRRENEDIAPTTIIQLLPSDSEHDEEPLRVIRLPILSKPSYSPFWITDPPPSSFHNPTLCSPGNEVIPTIDYNDRRNNSRTFELFIPQEIADLIVDEVANFEDAKERQRGLSVISQVALVFYPRTRKHLFSKHWRVNQSPSSSSNSRLDNLFQLDNLNPFPRSIAFTSYIRSIAISYRSDFSASDDTKKEHSRKLASLLDSLHNTDRGVERFSIEFYDQRISMGSLDWYSLGGDFHYAFLNFVRSPFLQELRIDNFVNVRRDFMSKSSVKRLVLRNFGLQEIRGAQGDRVPFPTELESLDYEESFALRRFFAPSPHASSDSPRCSARNLSVALHTGFGLEEVQTALSESTFSSVEQLNIKFNTSFSDTTLNFSQFTNLRRLSITAGDANPFYNDLWVVQDISELLQSRTPVLPTLERLVITFISGYLFQYEGPMDGQLSSFRDATPKFAKLDDALSRPDVITIPNITLVFPLAIFPIGNYQEEVGSEERERFGKELETFVRLALPKTDDIKSRKLSIIAVANPKTGMGITQDT
ncbi:unnamed protein product [Cyclocybe aegerita]|uniref:Uncharacterized protein n=1 Tax=Cyclocybe aegerita TaxID=1973307 RepID=A0A8S0WPN3_CYCAE|nr:unnamed protein product [Cyclocybe aegerita]